MQTVSTIGLDIAKSVFRVHGIDAKGNVALRRQLKRRCSGLFREAATVPGRYRGLRLLASLVARALGRVTADAGSRRLYRNPLPKELARNPHKHC
jgi:hypothetical protein